MTAFDTRDLLDLVRRHRLPILGAIGGLAVIYALFVFRPIQTDIASRAAEVERVRLEVLQGMRESEVLAKAEDEVDLAQTFIDACNERAVTERRQGELLSGLSQAAEKSGLELLAMQPEPGETFETFAYIGVRLQARGSYGSFAAFLAEVQELPFAMQIRECQLTANPSEEVEGQDSSDGAEFSAQESVRDSALAGSFAFIVFAGASDNSEPAGAPLADR